MNGIQNDETLTRKSRVDCLKRLINLLANLCASEDNFATDEDQQDDLRFDHAIDETREQLRLIRAKRMMFGCKTFETDGEFDVAGADDVLNLEVGEFGIEPKLLDDASVFARCKLRIIFRLCTRHHHLARGEDESCRLGVSNTHDDGSESLVRVSMCQVISTLMGMHTFGLYSAFRA